MASPPSRGEPGSGRTAGSSSRATAPGGGPIPPERPAPTSPAPIDVDLSATPFTNTLPIRRLGLRGGQAETIRVVYVRFPGLEVTLERQRYTCLEPGRRYRYESVDSDFTREIEVDPDGLVVTYPGLFRRVL